MAEGSEQSPVEDFYRRGARLGRSFERHGFGIIRLTAQQDRIVAPDAAADGDDQTKG